MRPQFFRERDRARGRDGIEVNLPFKAPYDWQSIIRFFQSHSITGIERVTDGSYTRVFRLGGTIGAVSVRAVAGKRRLKVRIVPGDAEIGLEAVRRIRNMFDLDCDPRAIGKSLGRVPLLATLCRRYPGLRLAWW